MTIELEQEFFRTFKIEPKYKTCIFKYCKNKKEYDCDNCGDRLWHYPEITAEKLLEMICIVFDTFQSFEINRIYTVETLKDKILSLLILAQDDVYNQIQQLFKEDNR